MTSLLVVPGGAAAPEGAAGEFEGWGTSLAWFGEQAAPLGTGKMILSAPCGQRCGVGAARGHGLACAAGASCCPWRAACSRLQLGPAATALHQPTGPPPKLRRPSPSPTAHATGKNAAVRDAVCSQLFDKDKLALNIIR
jgi:hypothetical protein